MSLTAGIAHLQSRLQASLDRIAGGTIDIYDGAKPATPATAVTTQVKLAEFTLNTPAGTIVGSATTSTLGVTGDATVLANGTAAWARIRNAAGSVVEMDSDVSLSAGSEAIKLSTLTLVSGGTVHVTSATMS